MKKIKILSGSFILPLLLSLLISAFLTALSFLPVFDQGRWSIYDMMLPLRNTVVEDPRILLVDIDDRAIAEINTYPVGRDYMAEAALLLKEFNSRQIILDIEFVDESPLGVNNNYLRNRLPGYFMDTFSALGQDTSDLLNAVIDGRIPAGTAIEYTRELETSNWERHDLLWARTEKIARDNDIYLGKSLGVSGRAFATINMLDITDPSVSEDLVKTAMDFSLPINIKNTERNPFPEAAGIRPAVMPVLSSSEGAGFTRVSVDPDGTRRRVDLLYNYEGQFFPQLSLAALWNHLDKPPVFTNGRKIVFELPGADLEIPLDQKGKMLINWSDKEYIESFRHLSFADLYLHDRYYQDILHNLRLMAEQNLHYFGPHGDKLLPLAADIESQLENHLENGEEISEADRGLYRQSRENLLSYTESFLNSSTEEAVLQEYNALKDLPNLSKEQLYQIEALEDWVPLVFSETRKLLSKLTALRKNLSSTIDGSFCFLGYTGTSTTDIGVTPFSSEYMNLGLYAAVTNTILQRNFLMEFPIYGELILAILLITATSFLVYRLKPVRAILAGFFIFILLITALGAVFILTGLYISPLAPGTGILVGFISLVIIDFLKTAKERSFIQSAFGQYLSNDVISELVNERHQPVLGGQEKEMTALFSDIQRFSTISEKVTPPELVELLNIYLTAMSDLIMDQRGTIDKYEGDAIIAFFGAPKEDGEHAVNACLSALKMKKREHELNRELKGSNLAVSPLHTRIGINSGPMVVGNMGTLRKMDYTIMGNSVNLASRLEGVNKQYGTWIMISEETYRKTGKNRFLVRRLDRVRVVGIHTPVRLYNLAAEASGAPENLVKGITIFNESLNLFEKREYKTAREGFREVLSILPSDSPSGLYIERIDEFLKNPPDDNWDGVFEMTEK